MTEVLAYKLIEAAKMKQVSTVMLAGGVSANTILRDKIQLLADTHELEFLYPKKIQYCMDNAAMVGINTYYKVRYEKYERDIYQVTV
ncbi:MAG: hypothetical protein H6767_07395 [Candidatus Peribacteria bacterium]|nr:MAG: hypothetical protein H6767_07395 [Candidatus Peribacteria bacterium]